MSAVHSSLLKIAMSANTNVAGHTCLIDLFDQSPLQVCVDSSVQHEYWPKSGVDGPTLEFEIASDNNVYIDPGDINLSLAVKIEKGNDGDDKLEWDETEKTGDEVGFINNVMHSLFKNCEVFVNQQSISESNGLYAHKAYVETEWSYSAGSKNTFIATQGYGHVSNPNEYASHTKAGRMTATRKSQTLNLYGPLAIDFFANGSLILPGMKMRIKLVRSSPKFVLFANGDSANETYNVVIEKAALIVEKKILRESSHNSITKTLALTNAQYNVHETLLTTFILPR